MIALIPARMIYVLIKSQTAFHIAPEFLSNQQMPYETVRILASLCYSSAHLILDADWRSNLLTKSRRSIIKSNRRAPPKQQNLLAQRRSVSR